ncbi:hypothetical protein E0H75_42495 [Kribbella capetownensis]|uniref:Aminoglycoside phosphotransferase domain-containing protein n=1 Tax=Kribbella capetownensis TaxID=1572659 RepID=A0A4R0IPU8_9ACTN|nr:hypothetical protein [Kribbella capetownensis]TCC33288.1 hypothetical protein E0H75_42495 [Kribbella capetownensis]
MRLLPDKPSMEFLRKQAKDLLVALRETTPGSTLADAQRTLAGEYGLHDWPTLKAEVDRRNADAPVAPDGLADELATAFGLGRTTGPATPVSFTPMGRSWALTTDRGRWLAVTVYPFITPEQAEIGARLRDAAVKAGVTAPVAVRSPQGQLIERVRDESWRVHEWIEVGPSPVTPVSTAVARQVGTTFATLHALAIPSEAPISPYLTWRQSDAEWRRLLHRAQAAGKPWADQLEARLPSVFGLYTIDADVTGPGFILCNSNLQPSTVRQGRNDELVVTEWDFTGSLTPEFEVASSLTQWAMRPSVNRRSIAAFREGYLDRAEWPKLELTSFGIAVTGWLNWAYNTICEAIDPDNEDRAEFAEREAIGVLNRPMTRTVLEEILDA